MPKITKPKLTNRGPAGLKDKLTPEAKERLIPLDSAELGQRFLDVGKNGEGAEKDYIPCGEQSAPGPMNKIAEGLKPLIVDIADLIPDPNNARLHPDRNMEAIKDSLRIYGQVKPLVVRRSTNVVIAGNGTLEAAKQLGWNKLAVNFVDMTDVEAVGFGLADNRTAELAKWDFEVVARLDKLILEAQHPTVGWSDDELEVLRAADWTPPPILEGGDEEPAEEEDPLTIKLTDDQRLVFDLAINMVRDQRMGEDNLEEGDCLKIICQEWMGVETNASDSVEDEIPF